MSTMAVIAHYGLDGLPACREFEDVKGARRSFSHMVEFRSRLRAKDMDSSSEVLLLFTREQQQLWVCEKSVGCEAEAIRLARWAGLRTRRVLEGRWAAAYLLGFFLRGLFYIFALRVEPGLVPRPPLPRWATTLANFLLKKFWPFMRVAANDAVADFVVPVVNAAIGKMTKKPIEKVLGLSLDVGAYAPEVSNLAVSPSLFSSDALDVDFGLVLPGDGLRMTVDVLVDGLVVRGHVRRCEVRGRIRLKLGPLMAPFPCARDLRFGFSAKPVLRPLLHFQVLQQDDLKTDDDDILHGRKQEAIFLLEKDEKKLKAVERFVVRLVENVVESTLCWPRNLTIPMAASVLGPSFEDTKDPPLLPIKAPVLVGALRVEVQRCANLPKNRDKGLPNPYVVAKVGQIEERTTTQTTCLDPEWRTPRTFVFDLHETSQICTLSVYDSDPSAHLGAFNDPLLGRAHFCLEDLNRRKTTELRLTLQGGAADFDHNKRENGRRADAAVYVLAKFTKAPGLADLIKDRPTGLVPLALAAVYVFCFAVLIDLVARQPLLYFIKILALTFLLATATVVTLAAMVLITGMLTLNLDSPLGGRR